MNEIYLFVHHASPIVYSFEFEACLHRGEGYVVYLVGHLIAEFICCKQEQVACVVAQHAISWVDVLQIAVVPACVFALESCGFGQGVVAEERCIEICIGLVQLCTHIIGVYLPFRVAEQLEFRDVYSVVLEQNERGDKRCQCACTR